MTTPVTAYQATDGTLFLTAAKCDKYEAQLAKRQKIMDFLAGPDNTLREEIKSNEKLLDFIGYWEQWQKTH